MKKLKEKNLLEELFVHEKTYKGFARIKKSGSKGLRSANGLMGVYWGETLADQELKKGEIVVECEVKYYIS